jgi:four helix bundle protein
MAFKFEELKVWQRALEFTFDIDMLIRTFPSEEKFALASQIKRAADSVVLNIAEGSTGQTNKEFARFLGIALRSGVEVVACLHLGKRRKIISEDNFSRLYAEVEEIVRMIQGLRKSLK